MRHECIICGRTLGRGVDLLLVTKISRHRGPTFVCSVCRQYLADNFYDKTAAEPPTVDGSDVAPPADNDLAQMAAVLAAEGYAWVHPLDGSPKRLEKVARPADDVRAILEGAARGRVATTLMGEAGPEALEPLIGELRALRLDMDALREAERRREAAARDAADVLDAAARGPSPEGAPTRGEGGE